MIKRTHVAIGTAVTIPIIIKYNNPFLIIGIIGSIIPDYDLRLGIQHRTSTHSLLAILITSIPVILINKEIGLIFALNYLVHLILDSFTKMGVPFLYPFNKKYYGMKLVKTGESEDLFLCLLGIYIIINELR